MSTLQMMTFNEDAPAAELDTPEGRERHLRSMLDVNVVNLHPKRGPVTYIDITATHVVDGERHTTHYPLVPEDLRKLAALIEQDMSEPTSESPG